MDTTAMKLLPSSSTASYPLFEVSVDLLKNEWCFSLRGQQTNLQSFRIHAWLFFFKWSAAI
jgi:hypothetical protein